MVQPGEISNRLLAPNQKGCFMGFTGLVCVDRSKTSPNSKVFDVTAFGQIGTKVQYYFFRIWLKSQVWMARLVSRVPQERPAPNSPAPNH